MKKVFFWIGLTVAAAAGIAFCLCKDRFMQAEQNEDERKEEKEPLYDEAEEFVKEKREVKSSLSERHKEAAEIIRETLEEELVEEDSQHKVDFDEIDSKLDELLDEE